ncbi:MAG: zinc-ribbon domain-containing protein [Clostridiales bacterium]|nr:zinc-ribbon domain-containing protein [Clostridiales bacterium]
MNIFDKAFDKSTDFIASKLSGGKVKTIRIELEEMVEMISRNFLSGVSDEDRRKLLKAVKGSWFKEPKIISKDEKYKLTVSRHRRAHIFNLKDANKVTITELVSENEEIIYAYSAFFYGKFYKAVKASAYQPTLQPIPQNSYEKIKPEEIAQKSNCPSCGAEINKDTKFCPECGSPTENHCPKCNAVIAGTPKFCPECGEKL